MPDIRKKRKAQHPLRITFRWCRIVVLLLICVSIGLILWANIFDLPGFVGTAIKKEVRRRSIDLEFGRLRMRGFGRVVADEVSLKSSTATHSPRVTVGEAEFLIDYERLKGGEFSVSGLRILSGELTVPLDTVHGKSLLVTNIQADVIFDEGDALRVRGFSAETMGTRARVAGELRNISQFRFSPGRNIEGVSDWQRHLMEALRVAEQLHFRRPPTLSLSINADGADLPASRVSLSILSGEATSKWGTFDRLRISSALAPAASNNAVRGDFFGEIHGFRTQYGHLDSLRVEGETRWSRNMEQLLTNHVQIAFGAVDAKWFRFANALGSVSSSQESTNAPIRSVVTIETGLVESSGIRIGTNLLEANLTHPLPFSTPSAWLSHLHSAVGGGRTDAHRDNEIAGDWRLKSSAVKAGKAEIESVEMVGRALTDGTQVHDPSLGLWQFIASVKAPWQMVATNARADKIEIGSLSGEGSWNFPRLVFTNLDAKLYGGYLKGAANLDVTSRKVNITTDSDFPYEKLSSLLDKPVQRWFSQVAWQDSPHISSEVQFQLPGWTEGWTNLQRDITQSLKIAGNFEGGGDFRGVAAERASSDFLFTNFVWTLPNMVITRPEGQALISYSGNVTNADFYWKVDSRIDPGIIKPLFPTNQQPALEFVKFIQPPRLQAEAMGNWDDETRLGVKATLIATNFFVKEQAFSDVRADIFITNGLIYCTDVMLHRGKEELRAPYLRLDLPGEIIFVTNAVSTIDPYIAMSLVGDDAYEAIDPYRFAEVPTVRINGIVPLRHYSKADLHFEVAGNQFTFWRFRIPSLVGDVYWKADHIAFSNIVANFYGGKARWSGYFVIDHKDDSANFSFAGATTNSELKYLVADLSGETNQMEGTLDGELIITSANSKNDKSWSGYGSANIQDGFLWNVPVFGIFSSALEGIAPGLGSSRISAGTGTFMITNSVVHTRDMQVRAPTFRLSYKGQVDLDGKLDAIVEAQILRDAWIVGRLFSLALWPVSKAFEAKVSGTVNAPKTDLRFFPKFLLAPFRNSQGELQNENTPAPAPVPTQVPAPQ